MTDAGGHRCYVLHSRPYRESSALVELLTAAEGRVQAVARGLRRKGRVTLQPFVEYWGNWQGRGELKTLTNFELAGALRTLTGERLYAGLYLNELTVRLIRPCVPLPSLFQAYVQALDGLAGAGTAIAGALRAYEAAVLDVHGYGLDSLETDAMGRPLENGQAYRWDWTQGWVPVSRGGEFTGAELEAVRSGAFHLPEVVRTARRLFRQRLDILLGARPLRSRALFKAYKEKQDATATRSARGQH